MDNEICEECSLPITEYRQSEQIEDGLCESCSIVKYETYSPKGR